MPAGRASDSACASSSPLTQQATLSDRKPLAKEVNLLEVKSSLMIGYGLKEGGSELGVVDSRSHLWQALAAVNFRRRMMVTWQPAGEEWAMPAKRRAPETLAGAAISTPHLPVGAACSFVAIMVRGG